MYKWRIIIQDLPSLKELAALSKRSAASSYLEPNNPQPLSFFSAFFSNSSARAIWSPIRLLSEFSSLLQITQGDSIKQPWNWILSRSAFIFPRKKNKEKEGSIIGLDLVRLIHAHNPISPSHKQPNIWADKDGWSGPNSANVWELLRAQLH